MKTFTEKDLRGIKQEAQRIREEYAYMDDLPLEGWMWEFIRRGRTYQDAFKAFEEQVTAHDTKLPTPVKIDLQYTELLFQDEEVSDKFFDLIEKGVSWPTIFNTPRDPKLYFIYGGTAIENGDGFPRPERKYCEFEKDVSPITYSKPAHWETGDDAFEMLKTDLLFVLKQVFMELDTAKAQNLSRSLLCDNLDRWIHRTLNIFRMRFGGGIVIHVDTKRGKEEIKAELNSIIDQCVEQSKVKRRDNKWKYYIIVYDLKQRGLGYPEISELLVESFPEEKNLFDIKNVENYWTKAHFLIDLNEYEKYR